LGLERGALATFARDQPLRFTIDASIWPNGCRVRDCALVLDPQDLSAALEADLHLGTPVDREHPASRDFSFFLTNLFA